MLTAHLLTMPALLRSYWEPEFQRQLRLQPLDNTLAQSRRNCRTHVWQRGKGKGRGRGRAERSGACLHRACLPIDLHKVRLGPGYAEQYVGMGKPRWQYQATKALPRVDPKAHTGTPAAARQRPKQRASAQNSLPAPT